MGGWVDMLKLKLTQSSLAGAGTELGKNKDVPRFIDLPVGSPDADEEMCLKLSVCADVLDLSNVEGHMHWWEVCTVSGTQWSRGGTWSIILT